MRRFILVSIILLVFVSFSSLNPQVFADSPQNTLSAKGTVLEVEEFKSEQSTEMNKAGYSLKSYMVQVKITSGQFKGQVLDIEHHLMNHPLYDIVVEKGTKVILELELDGDQVVNGYIADYLRDNAIYVLSIIFIILLLIIGRLKGLKTIITLALTLLAVFKVLIPGILKGYNPILLAIVIAALVTLVTIFLVGGINKKSFAAITGTLGGIIVAGALAYWSGIVANLTGLSSEEAQMLAYAPTSIAINFKGLLFSGIIIGALGAIMDVAMSISSSMEEVRLANPSINLKNLLNSGMNVGKDIMGTMSNTLILAYTGTSIPLILLVSVYNTPFIKVVNLDMIATEFIRALSGSIGLILSIPITALMYTLLSKNDQ